MAINLDAAALEARYAGRTGQIPQGSNSLQELGMPSGGVPGKDIPEGTVIQQVVGRGIMVVPPQEARPGGPQVAVVPPSGASRTSIGTFVEKLPETQMLKVEEPSPEVEAPKEEEPKPKRKLDLAQMLLDWFYDMGGDKSEELQRILNRSPETIKRWTTQPELIQLGAILKFLQRKPGVRAQLTEELEPHFRANGQESYAQSVPNRGRMSVMVCAPVLERPTLPFMWTLLYLAKKYELGFDVQSDTMIVRSRNMLAHRFLQSECTWSLWLDSDIAAPIGNPDWYKWVTRAQAIPSEYTAYDVLARLMSHNKAIVGGVYASRQVHGKLVIQPEINPRTPEDKLLCNEIRRGTARGLTGVDWIGFGCALVHRAVFLEIQQRYPQLAPKAEFEPWRYFQPEGSEGEDEAFCHRAAVCGVPIWLDTQLICGHIGHQVYLPEHTAATLTL